MKTAIRNSRPHKHRPVVWRRHSCKECGFVFTTYERPSLAEARPVHQDNGDSIEFNKGRLLISIAKAFAHDEQRGKTDAQWLSDTIEEYLLTDARTLTPSIISAAAHHTLQRYDQMAAMQYAAQHNLITGRRRPGRPGLRSL